MPDSLPTLSSAGNEERSPGKLTLVDERATAIRLATN